MRHHEQWCKVARVFGFLGSRFRRRDARYDGGRRGLTHRPITIVGRTAKSCRHWSIGHSRRPQATWQWETFSCGTMRRMAQRPVADAQKWTDRRTSFRTGHPEAAPTAKPRQTARAAPRAGNQADSTGHRGSGRTKETTNKGETRHAKMHRYATGTGLAPWSEY